MRSIKNPQSEAQHPAAMPHDRQGQGGSPRDRDPAGRQGAPHGKRMAPRTDAPPGLEQDANGNTIPVALRTAEDQEKAARARKKH